MKLKVVFYCLLFAVQYSAQTKSIEQAVNKYHKALIEGNEKEIDKLTHNYLSYGHSNGWVETKDEQIKNIKTNYLLYKQIKIDTINFERIKNTALVRFKGLFSYKLQGKDAELKLSVLEVWQRQNKKWKILARQSTKI